jgi:hypothetical protein
MPKVPEAAESKAQMPDVVLPQKSTGLTIRKGRIKHTQQAAEYNFSKNVKLLEEYHAQFDPRTSKKWLLNWLNSNPAIMKDKLELFKDHNRIPTLSVLRYGLATLERNFDSFERCCIPFAVVDLRANPDHVASNAEVLIKSLEENRIEPSKFTKAHLMGLPSERFGRILNEFVINENPKAIESRPDVPSEKATFIEVRDFLSDRRAKNTRILDKHNIQFDHQSQKAWTLSILHQRPAILEEKIRLFEEHNQPSPPISVLKAGLFTLKRNFAILDETLKIQNMTPSEFTFTYFLGLPTKYFKKRLEKAMEAHRSPRRKTTPHSSTATYSISNAKHFEELVRNLWPHEQDAFNEMIGGKPLNKEEMSAIFEKHVEPDYLGRNLLSEDITLILRTKFNHMLQRFLEYSALKKNEAEYSANTRINAPEKDI